MLFHRSFRRWLLKVSRGGADPAVAKAYIAIWKPLVIFLGLSRRSAFMKARREVCSAHVCVRACVHECACEQHSCILVRLYLMFCIKGSGHK